MFDRHSFLLWLLCAALLLPGCGSKSDDAPSPKAEEAPDGNPAKKLKKPKKATGDEKFGKLDFKALPKDYAEAMKIVRASQHWSAHKKSLKDGAKKGADPRESLELKMDRDVLEKAYSKGSAFLVGWQLPEGNFRYMYDWLDGTWVEDDHQVRQAGSLWGIATCYRYRPTPELKKALDEGLKFWFATTVDGPKEGTLMMRYGKDQWLHSGTVALVALAIIEYLATDATLDEALDRMETALAEVLA